MDAYQQNFLALAIRQRALRFGSFELKSGRISPYFFNAGVFADGQSLSELARCYAQALLDSGIDFDMLFGPAYKGIPLAATTANALWQDQQRAVAFAYDRKEAKDHGEGGQLVGAPLSGRVVIVDDVISAGTSVRHSLQLIRQAGAEPAAVLIALDRQEKGPSGTRSAAQALAEEENLPVIAIAGLDLLIEYLEAGQHPVDLDAMRRYRSEYGAA